MIKEEKEYIQLPPLHKDTDREVVTALWEYMKLPEDCQDAVLEVMKELEQKRLTGEEIIGEEYQKLDKGRVSEFQKVMQEIVNSLLVDSCNMAAWIYQKMFVENWTLEMMVNDQPEMERYIFIFYILFNEQANELSDDKDEITS